MNTYECVICLSINHSSKLTCSTCGTIPAQYSILGVPAVQVNHISPAYIPTVVAIGVGRANYSHASKTPMRTVRVDYYADSDG